MSAWIFWSSLILVAYTYAGYAVLVALLARMRGSVPPGLAHTPPVTVVITAYNEAPRIAARVRNILAQDYPPGRLFVVVVSDGSDDGTERAAAIDDRVRVLALPANTGKAAALNAAMAAVRTEFVAFTDARQSFAPDALRRLLAAFADPRVGAVTGELKIVESTGSRAGDTGLYWRMEQSLREGEALLGWLHGVSGAVYALRTELFRPLPSGTILDDMWLPLHVGFARRRIWMARDAIAHDIASATGAEEYRRKLRTLAGNWQLIARLPRLLNPWRNPLFFPWVSHKLLRLIAPWALIAAWAASAMHDGDFYRLAFFVQSAAYIVAAFALLAPRLASRIPLLSAAGGFVMLNAAALLSLPACLALDSRRLWKKH
ncbi:MAG TPA: glycosyltransferase family 2 protein [Rudaea sp.]|nr:glycosyltransferase family 2 protein [Rudaea sp.]